MKAYPSQISFTFTYTQTTHFLTVMQKSGIWYTGQKNLTCRHWPLLITETCSEFWTLNIFVTQMESIPLWARNSMWHTESTRSRSRFHTDETESVDITSTSYFCARMTPATRTWAGFHPLPTLTDSTSARELTLNFWKNTTRDLSAVLHVLPVKFHSFFWTTELKRPTKLQKNTRIFLEKTATTSNSRITDLKTRLKLHQN